MTRMDKYGDRFDRRNGRWVKITKQDRGGYTVVRGYEGDIQAMFGGVTRNVRFYNWAKLAAFRWLDESCSS